MKAYLFIVYSLLSSGVVRGQILEGIFERIVEDGQNESFYDFSKDKRGNLFAFKKVIPSELFELGTTAHGFYEIRNDTLYEYTTYSYSIDQIKSKNFKVSANHTLIHLYVSEEIEDINVKSGISLRNKSGEDLFYFLSDGRSNPFTINKNTGVEEIVIGAAPQTVFKIPVLDNFWGKQMDIYLSFYDINLNKIYLNVKDQKLIINNKYFVHKLSKSELIIEDHKGNLIRFTKP